MPAVQRVRGVSGGPASAATYAPTFFPWPGCPNHLARSPRRAVRAARPAAATTAAVPGGTIAAIQVEGNHRIEAGTIRSYMLVRPGDPFDPDRLDRSLKTLYATGLFQDVRLDRQGNTLVVHIVENPLVSRVAFEGNHEVDDKTLTPNVQLRPARSISPQLAEDDRRHILDLYAQKGYYDASVTPQIIRLPDNRVNVVFRSTKAPPPRSARSAFVGNHAFSQGRLSEVINSREQRWWRFLSSSDEYNPERLNYDKELLRRFYLKSGYTDIDMVECLRRAVAGPQGVLRYVHGA